ncbi:peptidoglycan editing factor PgeF [Pusillimonas sp. 7-48]|uniref:Purine nucleoside phosphorylase n=1 Tax=Pusillimonas minor TaxID=2697024 RepID=A0A842HQE3_9BURK|nr:peptidoglycan editing factor PgeF [Pusillimonas minor]
MTTRLGSFQVVSGTPWRGVRYFCTTRLGGHSVSPFDTLNFGAHVGDDAAAVQACREALTAQIGAMPVWLDQVHGTVVHDADASASALGNTGQDGATASTPVADAAVTSCAGHALAVLTADCLPVVVADDAGQAVAVAHAGWRGLAAGVLDNTVAALQARLPAQAELRAWIGPAIGQSAFEVGPDVYAAFCDTQPENTVYFVRRPGSERAGGKWLADLAGLARHRLAVLGVRYIEQSNWCTYRHPELFYSYRFNHPTGRMATLAWLDPATDLP